MKFALLILLTLNVLAIDKEKEALKAIKSLGMNLKKELQAGMKKSPTHALKICNTRASSITSEAQSKGIKLGRVSSKNRNKDNQPKEWMKDYITKFNNREIKSPYIVVDLKGNKKGLLKPIVTMPVCLKCHGESVDEQLYKEVLKHYPNDKAVGYKVGDIRGFFWAEY